MIYTLLLIPGGGYYWEFLVGVWCPVLRILTLLQTKKCHFPHPFSDQISKIHTHFRTWPNYLRAWNSLGLIRQKLCHHYQVRAETKKFSKCISNSHISISFLFIWN